MRISLERFRQNRYVSQLAQRLIALDLGSSHIKIVLAEEMFGKIRFLKHQVIDLQQEGLLSIEEVNRHLRSVVDEWGDYPVSLAIPQHLASAHLIELPPVPEREIKVLIQRETYNLVGLSEAAIIYDYYRLRPFGRHRNPFWVANAREEEIRNQIHRLSDGDSDRSVCEITTAASAMIAAFLQSWPQTERVVLADLGATSTILTVIDHGQGVYATSFPIGSESFTSAISSLKRCTFEEAEAAKRSSDLFSGSDRLKGLLSVVDVWYQDLAKIVLDWEDDNPELKKAGQPPRLVLCGGGSCQPGLVEYLNQNPFFRVEHWPGNPNPEPTPPMDRFAIVCGLVYQSFRKTPRLSSLLPADLRSTRLRQQMLMQSNWVGFYLLLLLTILLFVGTLQKVVLTASKGRQAADAELALKKSQTIETLVQQRESEYAKMMPLLEHQIRTANFVKALQALQQIRATNDLWFVLLADQDSYRTGLVAPTNLNTGNGASELTYRPATGDTVIAELCINVDKPEDRLRTLRDLVEHLKAENIFRNVDSLPSNQRNTNIVDPRVLSPDRSYSLALQMIEPENLRPIWRSNQVAAVPNRAQATPAAPATQENPVPDDPP